MPVWLALAIACDAERCIEVPDTCAALYEPTWEAVYTNTVSSSCALAGCHGDGSTGGGLGMGSDSATAYAAVLAYVVPGDPSCSRLVDHLEPAGIGDMPVGETLPDNERCAIRTWIARGAEGP